MGLSLTLVFFAVFMAFLRFSWISFGEIFKFFTAHRIQRDKNFKPEKSRICKGSFFSIFSNLCLYRCQKTGLMDIPEKRDPTKVKYLITICQVLRNSTKGNARQIHCPFWFCAQVYVIRYRKIPKFFFERAHLIEHSSSARA